MTLANSSLGADYAGFWHLRAGLHIAGWELTKPLEVWVNDLLMAVFFFLVGLEIKREFLYGSLSSWRAAALPGLAALGGMVVPALLFLLLNRGGPGQHGWGVPMATDIAFSLGVLLLLGHRAPPALRVFLLALAVIDDLGAIAVIAVCYTAEIQFWLLALGLLCIGLSWICNRLGVRRWWIYAVIGIGGTWLAFLHSGVHATIAGVLSAFTIPLARDGGRHDVAALLQRELQPIVNFGIMPVFALANAGVRLEGSLAALLAQPVTLGAAFGLLLGKPLGVVAGCWLGQRWLGAPLPGSWLQLLGLGLLGGIGFTMALFVANLAFASDQLVAAAKLGVLLGSALAGIGGTLLLSFASRHATPERT